MRLISNVGRDTSCGVLRHKGTATVMYVRGASRKQRTFCHTKVFIDNRKEKEYAGFTTHLHLLLHIVTLDIEALVVP